MATGIRYFNHTQASPAQVWTIIHGLQAKPISEVTVLHEGQQRKILPAKVVHLDDNTIAIHFTSPRAGVVRLIGT